MKETSPGGILFGLCGGIGLTKVIDRRSCVTQRLVGYSSPHPTARWSARKPNLPTQSEQISAALSEFSFICGSQGAEATCNNLAILAVAQTNLIESLTSPLADDISAELRKNVGAILHFTQVLAQDFGWIIGWSVVSLRHLWLSNSAIPEADKVPLPRRSLPSCGERSDSKVSKD